MRLSAATTAGTALSMTIVEKIFPPYFGWSHAAAIFVGYLLPSMVAEYGFSFGVGFVEGLMGADFSELGSSINLDHSLEILRAIVGDVAGGTVIVVLLRVFSKKFARNLWKEIGWMPCRRSFLVGGILVGLALSLGVMLVRYTVFSDIPTSRFKADGLNLIFWIIPSVLLTPVIEETLFRGTLYLGMLNSWGRRWAFGIVTILFSLSHLQHFQNGKFPPIFIFIVYSLLGIATLFLRVQSNSLFPAIALHCSYNVIWLFHTFSRLSPLPH